MSSSTNSTGLTPEQSKQLEERSIQSHEEAIIKGLKELYSCAPTESTFNIYSPEAVFHDPVGIARGVPSIRAQFMGLSKIFSRGDIIKFRVLENPPSAPPPAIIIDQDVAYYRKDTAEPTKVVNSLLRVDVDASNNKVVRHMEEWDHNKTSSSEDGFFGTLNEYRKKLTASATDKAVGTDKK